MACGLLHAEEVARLAVVPLAVDERGVDRAIRNLFAKFFFLLSLRLGIS